MVWQRVVKIIAAAAMQHTPQGVLQGAGLCSSSCGQGLVAAYLTTEELVEEKHR